MSVIKTSNKGLHNMAVVVKMLLTSMFELSVISRDQSTDFGDTFTYC